ncbi:MAG TPA: hypothetical protein VH619_06655 [Verrucomicrobiae bacterium]|nr:hypothetical protein [Verrucomicrobiae bacterium]
MPSRIPSRKALVTFVPDGPVCPPAVELAMREHPARWYPQPQGHRVMILYEGGEYDAATFYVEPEAWDHEDCSVCGQQIPPMTLCHVTKRGRYIAICENCYHKHIEEIALSFRVGPQKSSQPSPVPVSRFSFAIVIEGYFRDAPPTLPVFRTV